RDEESVVEVEGSRILTERKVAATRHALAPADGGVHNERERLDHHGAAHRRNSLVDTTEDGEQITEVEVRNRVARVDLDRAPQGPLCPRPVPLLVHEGVALGG